MPGPFFASKSVGNMRRGTPRNACGYGSFSLPPFPPDGLPAPRVVNHMAVHGTSAPGGPPPGVLPPALANDCPIRKLSHVSGPKIRVLSRALLGGLLRPSQRTGVRPPRWPKIGALAHVFLPITTRRERAHPGLRLACAVSPGFFAFLPGENVGLGDPAQARSKAPPKGVVFGPDRPAQTAGSFLAPGGRAPPLGAALHPVDSRFRGPPSPAETRASPRRGRTSVRRLTRPTLVLRASGSGRPVPLVSLRRSGCWAAYGLFGLLAAARGPARRSGPASHRLTGPGAGARQPGPQAPAAGVVQQVVRRRRGARPVRGGWGNSPEKQGAVLGAVSGRRPPGRLGVHAVPYHCAACGGCASAQPAAGLRPPGFSFAARPFVPLPPPCTVYSLPRSATA